MEALTPDSQILWRFAVVILLIGGIVALTWARTVNNVRAVIQVSELNESYARGDLPASVSMLDRAISLAPDVYVYYNNRGTVYSGYRDQSKATQEPDCDLRTTNDVPYETCLASFKR